MDPLLLRGSCACNRNQWQVKVPSSGHPNNHIEIIFNNSSHTRRLQASPLTAFIKVPIPLFRSWTVAFRPDETHQSIRRTFSTPDRDHLRHQFCGYCGTALVMLDDSSSEEDQFISVTLGSLIDEDLEHLTALGLLEDVEEEQLKKPVTKNTIVRNSGAGISYRGAPWFEDLVEDSALGRVRRQRGGHTSADGSVQSTWEVVEWNSADKGDESSNSKRKSEHIAGSPEAE